MSHSLDSVKITVQKKGLYNYTFILTDDCDYVWLRPLILKDKPKEVFCNTVQPNRLKDAFWIPITNNISNYFGWTKRNVSEFSESHIDRIIISTPEMMIRIEGKDDLEKFLLKDKRHFRNRHLLRFKLSKRRIRRWNQISGGGWWSFLVQLIWRIENMLDFILRFLAMP